MLALLLEANISVQKVQVKDGVNLLVDEDRLAEAVTLLKRFGLPEDKYAKIEDIFPQDGLISSPTAERARYMYALSEGISHTLSQIDGVVTARVHVVVPKESGRRGEQQQPSASVFIKHLPELVLENSIPQIKLLVSSSIEGLSYDNVNVVLFPATELNKHAEPVAMSNVLGMTLSRDSVAELWIILTGLSGLLIMALSGAGFFWWRQRGLSQAQQNDNVPAAAAELSQPQA